MAESFELDATDIAILKELQSNCRITNKELASKIHLSTTPTFERQRRLERLGIIKQYAAIVDEERVGKGFSVICNISTSNIFRDKIEDFRRQVAEWPEVTECYNVSGDYDFVMKVSVGNMKEYQHFITNKVGAIEFINKIHSVFIMDTLKLGYGVSV